LRFVNKHKVTFRPCFESSAHIGEQARSCGEPGRATTKSDFHAMIILQWHVYFPCNIAADTYNQ
jgi:hypothetical protein